MKLRNLVSLVLGLFILSTCSNDDSTSTLENRGSVDFNALVAAMSGQCNANPFFIQDAALRKKMESESAGEVYWRPFSNEKAGIFAGNGNYVAQIAIGQSTRNGQFMGYRIYYAPMHVWNPVHHISVSTEICNGTPGVISPPVVIHPPVVIIAPVTSNPGIPFRSCNASELYGVKTCANFQGSDPQRGNINAKGQCTQRSTRTFQVVQSLGCVVQCPQELFHWGSGRFEGLPIFNGSSTYYVQRDGVGSVAVTLSSNQRDADVTRQICN